MRILKKNVQFVSRNEFLMNNIIDKDLQGVLRPLMLAHSVIMKFMYRIRDNFITANDNFSNILLCCSTLIFIAMYTIQAVVDTLVFVEMHIKLMISVEGFNLLFYSTGYILTGIFDFISSKSNVEIILKIQAIHNVTKSNKNIYFKISTWIWVSVLVAIGNLIGFTLYFRIYFDNWNVNFVCVYPFDINIIYITSVLILLKTELNLWTYQIKHNANNDRLEEHVDSYTTLQCHQMCRAYMDILQAFTQLKNNCKVSVSFHVVDTFVHALAFMKTVINIYKYEFIDAYKALTKMILVWVVKTLIFEIFLSIVCERFYLALENSQATCNILFNKSPELHNKRMYKNIRRAYKAKFSKMGGCGMFVVDATLPLRMLDSITNYTVVFLQFAFL